MEHDERGTYAPRSAALAAAVHLDRDPPEPVVPGILWPPPWVSGRHPVGSVPDPVALRSRGQNLRSGTTAAVSGWTRTVDHVVGTGVVSAATETPTAASESEVETVGGYLDTQASTAATTSWIRPGRRCDRAGDRHSRHSEGD